MGRFILKKGGTVLKNPVELLKELDPSRVSLMKIDAVDLCTSGFGGNGLTERHFHLHTRDRERERGEQPL